MLVLIAINGAAAHIRRNSTKPPADFRLFFGYTGPTQEVFRIDADGRVYVTAYYGLPVVTDYSSLLKLGVSKRAGTQRKRVPDRKARLKNRLSTRQIRTIFAELQWTNFLNRQNYWLEGCSTGSIVSESKTYRIWFRSEGETKYSSVSEGCDPAPGTKAARFSEIYKMLRDFTAGVKTVQVKSLHALNR